MAVTLRARALACLVLGVASGAAGWLGCGSSDDSATVIPPETTTDASLSDGNAPAADAAAPTQTCTPSLSGTPAWKPPTGYPRAACSHAQVVQVLTDCTAPTFNQAKCDADKAALAGCYECIDTAESAPALGPLIKSGAFLNVNYAGCIALEQNDAAPTSCGGTLGLALDCEMLACAAPCTLLDAGTNVVPFDTCVARAADGGPCAADLAKVSCPSTDPAYAICYRQLSESFQAYATRVSDVFCGGLDGGVPDGGSDSGDAGDSGTPDAGDSASDAPSDAPDGG